MSSHQVLAGFHAVVARLRHAPSSVKEVYVDASRRDKRMHALVQQAGQAGVKVLQVPAQRLDGIAKGLKHQGVLAMADKQVLAQDIDEVLDLLEDRGGETPLFLLLDGVTDPHNLGACLRTADAAGVHAVIAPKDRAVGLNATVQRVACGAAETVPYLMVTNLARTMRRLKERNVWLVGTDDQSSGSLHTVQATRPMAWVMGAEGEGMRRLTRETCDELVHIPMLGSVESLNVSVAGAVCLYETVRQRTAQKLENQMKTNGFSTNILHSDRRSGVEHGGVHKPLHPSTEYAFADARELAAVFQGKSGFTYARQGTPTTAALEQKVTQMEGGVSSVSFSTGMAALTATFFTLLKKGDHLISSQYIFGNTNSLFGTLSDLGVEVTLVDATDVEQVKAARRKETRMVFTETIANPGTQIADLKGLGQWCEQEGLVYVVDNTLSSPWLCRGIDFKASLVVNSLSKYIGGHGNALGGMVTETGLFDWSVYPNIADAYRKGKPTMWGLTQIKKKGLRDMGATLGSDAAHRLAVGAETLSLRMDRACANALALAQYLDSHDKVSKVMYPGLSAHPQHLRAADYFNGCFGALLSVELVPEIDVFDFLNRLKVLVLATHLGDTRTLVLPVAHTIYYEMGPEKRALMGIGDNMLRVSVGIEDTQDLLSDFDQALLP